MAVEDIVDTTGLTAEGAIDKLTVVEGCVTRDNAIRLLTAVVIDLAKRLEWLEDHPSSGGYDE